MNTLKTIQFNLREASTKRGIALFIAGSAALYHLFFGTGAPPNLDAILERADFWLSVGAQFSGIIGMFLPDEPKNVPIELPPLELQGHSERRASAPAPVPSDSFSRVRGITVDVPPGHYPASDLDDRGGAPALTINEGKLTCEIHF